MTADAWGIDAGFVDTLGVRHVTSPGTRAALVAAMGGDPAHPPAPSSSVRVVRAGERAPVEGRGELRLEDGAVLEVRGALPEDLPPGYHELQLGDRVTRLIVAPVRCHLPADFRAWGWAAQLYASRSSRSWGVGDLSDLARLARWSASLGAGLLLVNPLHAVTPVLPQEVSPYQPSSRRFRNVLYLDVDEVPGAAEGAADMGPLRAAGRALNAERRIDRDAVLALKMEALGRLWKRFGDGADFEAFLRAGGEALRLFATFCVLAERYGRRWRQWPAEYRRPDSAAVARVAMEDADRMRFHAWLQWLLDTQMAAAGVHVPLVQDLPIGVDPDGADAWAWQDVLALDASAGAPPDRYNSRGQDWGLPPFIPHRLAARGYQPFIETIRATLRHAGGLRIDHVMGLFRLFWIPRGFSPAGGAYVRYPADDLLGIVALESQRAGAFVVGEDLGTVEEGVRERLAEHSVLSYRLLWFEADPPARYPRLALAAITTHDLPTIRGLWTGSDVLDQRALGLAPNEAGFQEMRDRLARFIGLPSTAPVEEVIVGAHRVLAQAPSMAVTATLDDALGVAERPNMPGTVAEWPNWSLALPKPLEAIETDPLAARIAAALARRAAGPPP